MEDVKYEMLLEKNIKSKEKALNKIYSKEKSEPELKKINIREEKRKIIKGETPPIEVDKNKNGFSKFKNISEKDSNYKGIKGNIKKYYKNNNKRSKINIKKNTYILIIMIFLDLIISNNNMIEYKFSNITLKIQKQGLSNILYSDFYYPPDIIYINGIQKY